MRSVRWLATLLVGAIGLLLIVGTGAQGAAAAPVDCASGPNWIVSNETELNDAITCYNNAVAVDAGIYTVTFDADITATSTLLRDGQIASVEWATQAQPGFSLVIDGAGFSLSQAVEGPAQHLLGIDDTANALVTISDLTITQSTDAAVIVLDGKVSLTGTTLALNEVGLTSANASILVKDSAITETGQVAILIGGDTEAIVDNSHIEVAGTNGITIAFPTSSLIFANSSLQTESDGLMMVDGSATIVNSTILSGAGAGTAIDVAAGTVDLSNSTIQNAGGIFTAAIENSTGTVTAVSSVVQGCVGVTDGGDNVGECFGIPAELGDFADNGCATPTPVGCVQTTAPADGSSPVGAGRCSGVLKYQPVSGTVSTGTLTVDQRGEPRTPTGVGCDAGAYEVDYVPCTAGPSWTVVDEAGFDAAVACYNASRTAQSYVISLGADIVIDKPLPVDFSFIEPITQAGPGFDLMIDGNGYALEVTGNRAILFAALRVAPASIVVDDIVLQGASTAFLADSSTVDLTNSAFVDNWTAVSSVGPDSLVRVIDSHMSDNLMGLQVLTDGFAVMSNTLVERTDSAVVVVSGAFLRPASVVIDSSTISGAVEGLRVLAGSVTLSNSTLSGSSVGVAAGQGSTITLANSTVVANNVNVEVVGGGAVHALSSIVDSCTGPVDDQGGNVGGCFGPSASVLALADNGCVTTTPGGCVTTHAPSTSSPALGAGECAGVAIIDTTTGTVSTGNLSADQRGQARTPIGEGCDSGSVELAPVLVLCNGLEVTINMNLNGGNGAGTVGDDVIMGTPNRDVIFGAEGNDTICGLGGNDRIRGGGGNDWIDGGPNIDVIKGQGGQDTIHGGAGDDRLDGLGAADHINGDNGNDSITGHNGVDVLDGGVGNDVLRGLTGADVMHGAGGDDELIGGNGNDRLFGGGGIDVCAGNLGPSDQAELATCESTPGVEVLF